MAEVSSPPSLPRAGPARQASCDNTGRLSLGGQGHQGHDALQRKKFINCVGSCVARLGFRTLKSRGSWCNCLPGILVSALPGEGGQNRGHAHPFQPGSRRPLRTRGRYAQRTLRRQSLGHLSRPASATCVPSSSRCTYA